MCLSFLNEEGEEKVVGVFFYKENAHVKML